MTRFIIERNLPAGLSRADIDDASRRAIAANADMPGVSWLHSHVAIDHSKFFCEYEASDEGMVRESATRVQIPCDIVTEVVEIGPEQYVGSRP